MKNIFYLLVLSCFCLLISKSWARALTLNEILGLAEKYSAELQQANSDVIEQQTNLGLSYSEILPTMAVGRKYFESKNKFQGNHSQSGEIFTTKSSENYLEVKEEFKNPYRTYLGVKAKKLFFQAAQQDLLAKKILLQSQVRIQFFKIILAEKSLEYADRNLHISQRDRKISADRFRRGFIDANDDKRAEILFRTAEVTFAERQQERDEQSAKLKSIIGLGHADNFTIVGQLPTSFKYFSQSAEFFASLSADATLGPNIEAAKLREDAEAANLQMSRLGFLPDLSFSAVFYEKQKYLASDERRPVEPEYTLGLRWEVFSGGRSYWQFRQSQGALDRAAAISRAQVDENELQKLTKLRQLMQLKNSFEVQAKTIQMLSEISENSRARFERGKADSKSMIDDISELLKQESRLLEISLKIIEAIAELSRVTGNAGLFELLI